MSLPIVSEETIKSRAKVIAELIKKEFGYDVPHGQCLKIVSQLFGFKNWNTAKALVPEKSSTGPKAGFAIPQTIGELIDALSSFDPSGKVIFRHSEIVEAEYDHEGLVRERHVKERQFGPIVMSDKDGNCEFGLINIVSLPEDYSPERILQAMNMLDEAENEHYRQLADDDGRD